MFLPSPPAHGADNLVSVGGKGDFGKSDHGSSPQHFHRQSEFGNGEQIGLNETSKGGLDGAFNLKGKLGSALLLP